MHDPQLRLSVPAILHLNCTSAPSRRIIRACSALRRNSQRVASLQCPVRVRTQSTCANIALPGRVFCFSLLSLLAFYLSKCIGPLKALLLILLLSLCLCGQPSVRVRAGVCLHLSLSTPSPVSSRPGPFRSGSPGNQSGISPRCGLRSAPRCGLVLSSPGSVPLSLVRSLSIFCPLSSGFARCLFFSVTRTPFLPSFLSSCLPTLSPSLHLASETHTLCKPIRIRASFLESTEVHPTALVFASCLRGRVPSFSVSSLRLSALCRGCIIPGSLSFTTVTGKPQLLHNRLLQKLHNWWSEISVSTAHLLVVQNRSGLVLNHFCHFRQNMGTILAVLLNPASTWGTHESRNIALHARCRDESCSE